MQPDEDLEALVERFYEAGKRLTSRSVFGDRQMGEADRAQRERLEVLHELVDRTSVDGAVVCLGWSVEPSTTSCGSTGRSNELQFLSSGFRSASPAWR